MMWEYGAGSHSKEEYQALMGRLNTGILGEIPDGYDVEPFVIMGTQPNMTPSGHAHSVFSIVNELISHAQLIILLGDNDDWPKSMMDYINENPNSINVFSCSIYALTEKKSSYDHWFKTDIWALCESKHFIMFAA